MSDYHSDSRETEDIRFPSGRWAGYECSPEEGRIRLLLDLTFGGETIRGTLLSVPAGITINGFVRREECHVVLRLHFAEDDVDVYSGISDGRRISGTWDCTRSGAKGEFRIWPIRGDGDGESEEVSADAPLELECVGVAV